MAEGPIIYLLARPLLRAALAIYFRRIEAVGREHIPSTGPVLLAANHPHSITDALVLAAVVRRPVSYLAHGGLFERPLQAWFLRRCGVVPIHRPRDDADAAQRNLSSFAACTELLGRGGVIGIFPEGTSQEERRVQSLRTGVSRIALESEAQHEFCLGVVIVPVGLNFESSRRFRSRVLLRFDRPLTATEYRAAYELDPAAAVRAMTEEIGRRIRKSVVHIERSELRDLIERIEHCYHAHLLERGDLQIEGETDFQQRQTLLREIASALEFFYEREPEAIWRLHAALDEYEVQLRQLRLSDELLRKDSRPNIRSGALRIALFAGLGAVPGLYGLAFNYIPYRVTGPLATKVASDHTKTHYFQLWVGIAAFSLYYAAAMLLIWRWFHPGRFVMSILFATWPLAGLFARIYVSGLIRQRRLLRLAVLRVTHGAALQQLRRLRRRLVDSMDAMLLRYLPHRRREVVE